ncbi:acetyl-CoA synthetase-like protein [Xylariaceae sp. FL0255]|nr:acetyl-CoA synthetase-like protein [Xylariaceae sp. FL0255]
MATILPPSTTFKTDRSKVVSKAIKPTQINSINDLIVSRAEKIPNVPLIIYPDSSSDGAVSWVKYTAKELDTFVDEAAKELTHQGLIPTKERCSKSDAVALLGSSDLDYAIAMLALSRMGFAVLLLSTRLPVEAFVSLLEKTECRQMVTTDQFATVISGIQEKTRLETYPLTPKSIYTRRPSLYPGRFERLTVLEKEDSHFAWIIHSSGSTGLPKPIFQTHRAALGNYAYGNFGMSTFVTTPLFHQSGVANLFRTLVANKCTALHDTTLAMTNASLTASLNVLKPDCLLCVPYILKLLSETDEGIEALKACKMVITGSAPCPDELGNLLVDRGVYIMNQYGSTEMGGLMNSIREKDDKTWNYLHPLPYVKDYIYFEPLGNNEFEVVVLDGLETKVMSNSDNPPNSYHTRDCFTPHPTRPGLWKFTSRLDDRIILVNGEKVLPLPMEGRIRQNELVQDCLLFGTGRNFPGMLVIPSEKAKGLSKSEFLDNIVPTIELANAAAEKFGQVYREMVVVLDPDVDYPQTDKGTMIRAKAYKHFASEIETAYQNFERPEDETLLKKLDFGGLKSYLLDLFRNRLGRPQLGLETDFFSADIDSLQAIRARGHMMRELDLGGQSIKANAVYENANILKLAEYLDRMRNNNGTTTQKTIEKDEASKEIQLMHRLVEKYSRFETFHPGVEMPEDDVVLLTGATGSLGAYVLAKLLPFSHINKVYCLVRAADEPAAVSRIRSSLSSRGLLADETLSEHNMAKIIALPSDLSRADLGLPPTRLSELQSSLTNVIHSAWAVNFNMGVGSFEQQHIQGTQHLLNLCLQVPFAKPARFSFISSVSAASRTPASEIVRERFVQNPEYAQPIGYGRSKWVAEHIVRRAAEETGIEAKVLRTGQLMSDTKDGRWNSTEAIPLMIRSATTLRALPALDESPSWLPMDVCADAVIELSRADKPFSSQDASLDDANLVYHVLNPHRFSWKDDLLPALRDAGLKFDALSSREWVDRLRKGDQDPVHNPTVKLLDFYAAKYDHDGPGLKGPEFETQATESRSLAIASRVDVIASGTIRKCVEQWKREWV